MTRARVTRILVGLAVIGTVAGGLIEAVHLWLVEHTDVGTVD